MGKIIQFFAVILVMAISGCAAQGKNSYVYVKGEQKDILNEVVADAPYDQVWDVLVRELAKSFYVINNIDKTSRIINVSLVSTEPESYVDCGRSYRTYAVGSKVESFNYNVASRSEYKIAATIQEHPSMRGYAVINREPVLEARSNIYIAPLLSDPSRTNVAVNTRYVLTFKTKGDEYLQHISGAVYHRGKIPEDSMTMAFNTGAVATKEQPDSSVLTCFANGKFEEGVLSIVKEI